MQTYASKKFNIQVPTASLSVLKGSRYRNTADGRDSSRGALFLFGLVATLHGLLIKLQLFFVAICVNDLETGHATTW